MLCIIAWARVKGISVCDVWAGVRETTGHWWRTRKKRGTGELVCVHMCQRVCVCVDSDSTSGSSHRGKLLL